MKNARNTGGLNRRQLFKTIGGLGIGLAASRLLGSGQTWAAETAKPLLREIPVSGEKIPAIGLGSARTFSLGGLASREPASVAALDLTPEELEQRLQPLREVLRIFHAEGGRLVDSSPMYGTSEELIGRLASELGIVDDLFMATKVWSEGREAGIEQMERSMALLHTEPLDIMLIHNLYDWRTQYQTLRDWKEQGRIRYIGISHWESSAHDEVEAVLRAEPFDVVQINYNALDRHAEQRLFPLVQEQGLATMINVPFGNGELFRKVRGQALPDWTAEFDAESWAQVFLKFIISHPAVTCAIPATADPDHARDNTRAMYGRMPDERQRARIVEYLESL